MSTWRFTTVIGHAHGPLAMPAGGVRAAAAAAIVGNRCHGRTTRVGDPWAEALAESDRVVRIDAESRYAVTKMPIDSRRWS